MIQFEYKMRAEAQADVGQFLAHPDVRVTALTFKAFNALLFSEGTATFTTSMTLRQIKDALATVPDGHVMLETVDLAHTYTGERVPQ